MASSPTPFRRAVLALAKAGLDIRPLAQRFRNAVLRPHRAEVAILFEQVGVAQRQLEQDIAALRLRAQCLAEARLEHATSLSAMAEALRSAAGQRDELQQRCFLLEQLLTGTAAARPPGAARAVAQLASPAVAVILPTHNRAAFIGEAIASVQAQSFRDWELIVVDDGSTDDTATVVAAFLIDPRIRYLRQQRAGSAVARNRGIEATGAPLIAYLDSDNLWYTDFLSRAVDCLATEPEVDLVYGALVTSEHQLDRRCILWSPFDRDRLLAANYIDTNVIVNRRGLVARLGGWDPELDRLLDWDLVLRYTADRPARALDVLAARYRACDDQRLSAVVPLAPAEIAIRRKWFPPTAPARRPRVLYVVWHYPQLSESYVETELRCMLAWGVDVEIWRIATGPASYPTSVPIHDGSLAAAIAASRPDILHVHWLSFGHSVQAELAASGLPVTLRLHGFDVTRESLAAWLAHDWVAGVYALPNQIARTGLGDARLKPVPVAFDTRLFKPGANKDRRLVVRTAAALASKDLELFLAVARLLPEHRFVLAAATCHLREDYVAQLKAAHDSMQSPAELMLDVPREAVAALVGQAGLYLHTMHPPDHRDGTPVGQPISIAEAMATGCYCLVREVPDLAMLVQDAGATYRDLDQLVGSIQATQEWTDAEWTGVQHRAIERAYRHHADVAVLQAMFNDWMELSNARPCRATADIRTAGNRSINPSEPRRCSSPPDPDCSATRHAAGPALNPQRPPPAVQPRAHIPPTPPA